MREIKKKLDDELKQLEYEFRVALPKEIGTAVAMGDLRENAEYHAALERQRLVKARISELRERLATLSNIRLDQIPRDRVGLGSTVVVMDLATDEERTYELVVSEAVDLERGMISIASPIGKSLLGRVEGDTLTVDIPAGQREYEIVELRTIHDKE